MSWPATVVAFITMTVLWAMAREGMRSLFPQHAPVNPALGLLFTACAACVILMLGSLAGYWIDHP